MRLRSSARIAALAVAAGASLAAAPAPLTSDQQALARSAETYLDGLTTAGGRFVQTAPNGQESDGSFWIQRPGKARFAYDAPWNLQIAADGRTVSEYDPRLKTVHSYPESSTPLALFLASHVALDQGARIEAVQASADGFSVVVSAGRRRGSIALDFNRGPTALAGWTVTDARGSKVKVRITRLERSAPKPAAFFVLGAQAPGAAAQALR